MAKEHVARLFASTGLAAGLNTVYTVPSSGTAIIMYANISNNATSGVPVTIEAGNSGNTRRQKITTIEVSGSLEFKAALVLSGGDVYTVLNGGATGDLDITLCGVLEL